MTGSVPLSRGWEWREPLKLCHPGQIPQNV